MINFWAIIKLTLKLAIRSHMFQLLLALLLVVIFVLPNTILGDGTALGFIQISLKYNLAFIALILSLSTIWLSCYTMNNDLSEHQLHLILTKSISRWKVWIGKCCAVFIINFSMLVVAGLCIYGQILWQYNKSNYSKQERVRLENEVLVGRRCYYPKIVDIKKLVNDEQSEITKKLQFKFGDKANIIAKNLERSSTKRIAEDIARVKPGPRNAREWTIKGLPTNGVKVVYLRYKIYVGKLFSITGKQHESMGLWSVQLNERKKDPKTGKITKKTYFRSVTPRPIPIVGGAFQEIPLPSMIIDSKGRVRFRYINFDRSGEDQFFQQKDGPLLLVKVTGFFNNYIRALFVISIWIAFIAVMSCCFATITTLFSALFASCSYIIIGALASFVLSGGESIISYFMKIFFISGESFDVSSLVSGGRLIEFSLIFNQFFFQTLVLKGIPFALVGIWIYSRREIGLVVKK